MTEPNQPLEETPEVAAAVEDDVTVSAFMTGGGPDEDNPTFLQPGEEPDPTMLRTGSDQQWEPEDLAAAHGWDPTPENIERARAELERDGAAAIEKIVP